MKSGSPTSVNHSTSVPKTITSTTRLVRVMRKATRQNRRKRLLGGGGISTFVGRGRLRWNRQISENIRIKRQRKFEKPKLAVQLDGCIGRSPGRPSAKLQSQGLRFVAAFEFQDDFVAILRKAQRRPIGFAARSPIDGLQLTQAKERLLDGKRIDVILRTRGGGPFVFRVAEELAGLPFLFDRHANHIG